MRTFLATLAALTLALLPATVLACAMEFDFPLSEDENDPSLVALMADIDARLAEPIAVASKQDLNVQKAQEVLARTDGQALARETIGRS